MAIRINQIPVAFMRLNSQLKHNVIALRTPQVVSQLSAIIANITIIAPIAPITRPTRLIDLGSPQILQRSLIHVNLLYLTVVILYPAFFISRMMNAG
jgi:hypothetical protein